MQADMLVILQRPLMHSLKAKAFPISAGKAYHNLAIIEAARRATVERRAIEIP